MRTPAALPIPRPLARPPAERWIESAAGHSFDGVPSTRVAVGFAACAALMSCAPSPRVAPPAAVAVPSAHDLACFVADTAAAPADTLHVIAVSLPAPGALRTDCTGSTAPPANPTPVVNHVLATGSDLRDVLDRGIPGTAGRRPDVVVTNDPEVLDYAALRGDYRSIPLPWTRTYVFIAPMLDSVTATPSTDARDEFARDAVRADVRGARPPFPWGADSVCQGPQGPPIATPMPVIGYAAGDAIAREIAERIVALAGASAAPAWIPAPLERTTLRTQAVPADSIRAALGEGRIGGAVTFLSRTWSAGGAPPVLCRESGAIAAGYAALALVDSRDHVLVRRGSGAIFYIGADGTLWFAGPHAP